MTWQSIETAPVDVVVLTKIDDENGCRNIQPLKRLGCVANKKLWFIPDESMYVYYTPTHWMPLSENPDA